MNIKTHQVVRGTVADPDAFRSLCGRSSGRVWRVETIESGANVADAYEQVTCKFCLSLLQNRKATS